MPQIKGYLSNQKACSYVRQIFVSQLRVTRVKATCEPSWPSALKQPDKHQIEYLILWNWSIPNDMASLCNFGMPMHCTTNMNPWDSLKQVSDGIFGKKSHVWF